MKPLSTAWTQHIQDPEAKADFEKMVRNSNLLLRRLQEILTSQEKEINSTSFSKDDFKDPNWSHKQAFRLGELARLKKTLEIITLT